MRHCRQRDENRQPKGLGSNAAYCTLRADRLTRVPAGLDAAEAAAMSMMPTTTGQSAITFWDTTMPNREANFTKP
jgi:NADPH:quinone reductase-like Zn-dependent oxidoreductase